MPELDLDKKFELAVKQIQSLPPKGEYSPSNDEKLIFYSLFKQATEGPCKQKKPAFYDVVGKLKWEAWVKVSKLSKDEAKKRYIAQFLKAARKIKDPQSKKVIDQITGGKSGGATASPASNSSKVTIYGTMLSQPTRTVIWFCRLNQIPYEYRNVDLFGQEHKRPEMTKLNPLQKVPFIEYEGRIIAESHTIVKFLARTAGVEDHWYPNDLVQALPVDTYLDWHHGNTRKACAGIVFLKFILGVLRKKQIAPAMITNAENELHSVMTVLNDYWLKDSSWIAGRNEISIADLFAFQEIIQLDFIPDSDLSKYPNVNAWMNRMKAVAHQGDIHNEMSAFVRSKL